MHTSKLKLAAVAALSLSALLALGACSKKVDDTTRTPGSSSSTTPDTGSGATGSGSGSTAGAMAPGSAASGARN